MRFLTPMRYMCLHIRSKDSDLAPVQKRLRLMIRRTKSGAVKHLYNPETILMCLHLARCKKAGCSVQDVLVEAAGLLLDDDDAKKVRQDF